MDRAEAIKGLRRIADWNFGKYEQTHEEDYKNDGSFLIDVAELLQEEEKAANLDIMDYIDFHPMGGFHDD